MATSHHGEWTLSSLLIIYIINKYPSIVKLDSGEQFNEYINVIIDKDNNKIVVENNCPASVHCVLYQLMKLQRG